MKTIEVGKLQLNVLKNTASYRGLEIVLRPRETSLLCLLIEAGGEIVEPETLWRETTAYPGHMTTKTWRHTLSTHMGRLIEAVGDDVITREADGRRLKGWRINREEVSRYYEALA